MLNEFTQQLLGAWRFAGLDASPRADDGVTFCCPVCVEAVRLEIEQGVVFCKTCSWSGAGEAWIIAKSATVEFQKRKTQNAPDDLPDIISAATMANQKISLPNELILGMLHRGSKMMLGGGSKSFKTWCLCDLALSISTGRNWWGRGVEQGRVLYLNLEVQEGFFWQRLQAISHAKGVSLPAELSVWNLRGFCCDHLTFLPKLSKRIAGENYAAIVLDPTYKITNGSENDTEVIGALMNSIEKMAMDAGAAVIFGAHFAKGNASTKEAIDRVSGSGVFARDPDAIVMVTRHEEDDAFTVEPILRNCPPIDPFCVRWQFPLMHAAPELDPAKLKEAGRSAKKPVPTMDQVVSIVTAAGGEVMGGGKNNPEGLVQRVKRETGASREGAEIAVEAALEQGVLIVSDAENPHGGKTVRKYVLSSDERKYVPRASTL